MKTLIVLALIALCSACGPTPEPLPCDAAFYDADPRPRLRVHVDERWPAKYAFYVRQAFVDLPVQIVEVDAGLADVVISPVEPHVTDCTYGSGAYVQSIYVDALCHEWDVEGITRDVARLLRRFVPLAR